MQLIILCKEIDLKHFGQSNVFNTLVRDLKILESEGIDLGDGKIVRGSLARIVEDNLESHTIGDFLENFTCEYFCRYCELTRFIRLCGGPLDAEGSSG